MEIRVLKYFLVVAQEENITRAAEILHITQPTLSRQMMQLEDELQTSLFVRGKRSLTLTPNGMLLKRRAEEIVALSEKTENEICQKNIGGKITLACGITQAAQTMGAYMKAFKEQYPEVSFSVRNGNTDFIVENIDNGLVDIGFVIEPVDLTKLQSIELPQPEKWGILMTPDSPLASLPAITPMDLVHIPLINSARLETQNQFKGWMGDLYDQLEFMAEAELTSIAAVLVKHRLGSAIVLEDPNIYTDLIFKPLQPALTTRSLVVWKKYVSFSPTISKFIEFLQQH